MKLMKKLPVLGLILLITWACQENELDDLTLETNMKPGQEDFDEGSDSEPFLPVTIENTSMTYEIWPCTAEDPDNQNPVRLSNTLGWEMAFNLGGKVFVSKATLNGSNITFDDDYVYITKATEFDAFEFGKDGDVFPEHFTTWYADVAGGDAEYYCPKLSEDQGWLIWTTSGTGIYFDLEPTGSGFWDIFFNGFNEWWQDNGVTNPIENYNLQPVSFDFNNIGKDITILNGNATIDVNETYNLQWSSNIQNADLYKVYANGSFKGQTTGNNLNLSFSSAGNFNVKIIGLKTDQYGAVTSTVYSPGNSTTITVESQVPPLTCSISGSSVVWLPAKGEGPFNRTWTTSASGGTAPYTYKWYSVSGSSRVLIGTGTSYTRQFHYSNSGYTINLEVDATDSNGTTVTQSKSIQVRASGGFGA